VYQVGKEIKNLMGVHLKTVFYRVHGTLNSIAKRLILHGRLV